MSIMLEFDSGTIKQDLADLPKKMLDYAFEALMEQAQLMKGLAQVYVPVDTGSLRDSIRVERGGEGVHWRRLRVRAGGYITNPKTGRLVNYATYVEAEQPFMRPAYDEIKPTLAEMIRNAVVMRVNEH